MDNHDDHSDQTQHRTCGKAQGNLLKSCFKKSNDKAVSDR